MKKEKSKIEGWEKIRYNSELAEIVERYAEEVMLGDKKKSQKAADDLATFIHSQRQAILDEVRGKIEGLKMKERQILTNDIAIEQNRKIDDLLDQLK